MEDKFTDSSQRVCLRSERKGESGRAQGKTFLCVLGKFACMSCDVLTEVRNCMNASIVCTKDGGAGRKRGGE